MVTTLSTKRDIPPSDPKALRQAMIYLWEHPEQAAEMGKRAEQRYWQLFTAEKWSSLMLSCTERFKITNNNS